MKIKNIVRVLLITFILASCAPAAKVVPTQTTVPTSTFASFPTTIHPTYVYLPTITSIPSSTPFVATPLSPLLASQHSQANYDGNVIVTIKSESLLDKGYRDLYYEVVLNFKNSSGKEITDVDYFLVPYQDKDAKQYGTITDNTVYVITALGSNEHRGTIPAGESDIVIDLFVYLNENFPVCKNGSLDKPLYLLLLSSSIGSPDHPLTASNELNQKILETPCKWT